MERNAHEEIITGTELATVPIPVGNSVVLPEGARIYITQMIGIPSPPLPTIGIRRISLPTKTETDEVLPKESAGIISVYTQYTSLTPLQGVSKSILALMSSHAPLRIPYIA